MPEALREPPGQVSGRRAGGGWQIDCRCVNTSKMSVYAKCCEDSKAQGHVAKAVSSWRWHVSCGLRRSGDKQAGLGDGQVPRPPARQWLTQALSPLLSPSLQKNPQKAPALGVWWP